MTQLNAAPKVNGFFAATKFAPWRGTSDSTVVWTVRLRLRLRLRTQKSDILCVVCVYRLCVSVVCVVCGGRWWGNVTVRAALDMCDVEVVRDCVRITSAVSHLLSHLVASLGSDRQRCCTAAAAFFVSAFVCRFSRPFLLLSYVRHYPTIQLLKKRSTDVHRDPLPCVAKRRESWGKSSTAGHQDSHR